MAGATTLRTTTLAQVHSTAHYCAPAWCHSAHIRLLGLAINDALRTMTGCLRPTPGDNISILTVINTPEIRRKVSTLSLAHRFKKCGKLWGRRKK